MNRDKFTPQQLKQIDDARKYWGTRLEDLNHSIEDRSEEVLKKLLGKEYKRSQREIQRLVEQLYLDMLEKGGITTSSLYEYGRFKSLSQNINKELKQLGLKEAELMNDELEKAYIDCFGKTVAEFGLVDFTLPNPKAIQRVVNMTWAGDNYSNRIWKNKTKLANKLESNIRNCVSLGISKDKAVKDIMSSFSVSFSDADRLVRSELMHVLNTSQSDVAQVAGWKYKSIRTAKDERTCSVCSAMDGDIYPVEADALPVHARCRCCFVFIKDTLLPYEEE